MGPTQYSAAGGPLFSLLVLVGVVLLCRWVFSTRGRDERAAKQRARALSRGDYGLLVPVATVRTQLDAELLRDVLAEGGVRATVSDGELAGEKVLLVFRGDEDRAKALVAS